MKIKYTFWCISILSVLGISCKSDFKALDKPTAGTADFSRYIAIGNSLTAGYADNSLALEGQLASYPNMLAQQFRLVNGGAFNQPLLSGNYGWPSPRLVLGYTTDCNGVRNLSPVTTSEAVDTAGSGRNIGHVNYNNLGVPGVKLGHITIPGYALLNPYAKRFFSSPNTQTAMDVYAASDPTFFTVWLGSNDVLGYATSGGEGIVGGLGVSDITNPALFESIYDSLINVLVTKGAKGVLINIPNVSTVPFFTTINPKGAMLNSSQATILNAAYNARGISGIAFEEGINYFVVEDDAVGARHLKPGELVLLTAPGDSFKCGGWGTQRPIPKRYVLDETELNNINTAVTAFNNIIANIASKHNLAYMDANSFLKSLASGFLWDGVRYTTTFVSGGSFSLDGIHLTQRGYGIVANELIHVINAHYKATLPFHNINQYPEVKFP